MQEKHTILIAEDVEENYFLIEVLFAKKYNLIHAYNGEEAVELFQNNTPELILMDIKMPKMDGFEAARQIRKLSPKIPIIALTAFAFEKEKEIAKECGFNEYIVKPVDISELRNLLDGFFDGSYKLKDCME